MGRLYQVTALAFLALGLYVVMQARGMEYFTSIGPGAGFFPFWLGLLMCGLSLLWLGQVTLGPSATLPPDFLPDRAGVRRVVVILGALALLAVLIDRLGYALTMLAFVLVLLTVVGRQSLAVALPLALLSSFGLYYVFRYWLAVQLPPSAVGLLNALGF